MAFIKVEFSMCVHGDDFKSSLESFLNMGLNGLNKNGGRFNIRSKNRNSLFTFIGFNNKEKSISSRVEENMNTEIKSHCLCSCANIDNLPRSINT